MSDLETLTERVRSAVGRDAGVGKTLKLDLKGEGVVFVDGADVSNEDRAADLTVSIAMEDLKAMAAGTLDPMRAVMTGKMKVSDMGLAMSLQPKIQALFQGLAR